MTELQERLASIPFTAPTVQVRAGLLGYMADIEDFSQFSPYDSMAEEGRTVKRLLGDAYHAHTHETQKEVMLNITQLDPYAMCEDRNALGVLTPEEVLKVLGIYGKAISDLGDKVPKGAYPLMEVTIAVVLGPKQAPDYTPSDYKDQFLTDLATDQYYWDSLKLYAATGDYDLFVLDQKERFIKAKYGLPKGYACGTPVNAETYPYDRSVSPVPVWDAVKPADYKQKSGTLPIVWNCSGDVS
jgi:hypothetical protein